MIYNPICNIGLPRPMDDAEREQVLNNFLVKGESIYSGKAETMWWIISYLETNYIPYTIFASPGNGYAIKSLEPFFNELGIQQGNPHT